MLLSWIVKLLIPAGTSFELLEIRKLRDGSIELNAQGIFQFSHKSGKWCRPGIFTPAPTPNRTCKFPSIRLSR